jgi:hypothetical protein
MAACRTSQKSAENFIPARCVRHRETPFPSDSKNQRVVADELADIFEHAMRRRFPDGDYRLHLETTGHIIFP